MFHFLGKQTLSRINKEQLFLLVYLAENYKKKSIGDCLKFIESFSVSNSSARKYYLELIDRKLIHVSISPNDARKKLVFITDPLLQQQIIESSDYVQLLNELQSLNPSELPPEF